MEENGLNTGIIIPDSGDRDIDKPFKMEDFVNASPGRAIDYDRSAVRAGLVKLAGDAVGESGTARKSVGDRTLEVQLLRNDEGVAFLINAEGRIGKSFVTLALPMKDWEPGDPMGIIEMTYTDSGQVVHINNSPQIASKVEKRQAEQAVRGVQWLAKNLLEWSGDQIYAPVSGGGSPELPG